MCKSSGIRINMIQLYIDFLCPLCREVLKEEILKYKGAFGDNESIEVAAYNPCPDFENSVNADFEAAQGVVDLMDFRTVEKFIDYLENCKGNVLISGIGETSYHV